MKRGGTYRGRCPAAAAIVLCLALAGCGGAGKDATAEPPPAPAEAQSGRARSQSFIDAGNEAYKAGDFELALKRYAAAAVADPRDPAAYFGMGMTFTRLKREDEARAAFARAQALSSDEGTQ
ncbi:MAG: tetratricopeptide repeat protein [Candidatus Eisenbacteria bacterium]